MYYQNSEFNKRVALKNAQNRMKKQRPIYEIAQEIYSDWGAKVSVPAEAYLGPMRSLNSIDDSYGCDTARSVIGYFLCNASAWRGEVARRVKKELNAMIK